MAEPAVTGSRRSFSARLSTTAPDAVVALWTDPATWGDWDAGLRSASVDGAFVPGASGSLVDLGGRTSAFVVRSVEPRRCVVDVRLPLAALRLRRTADDRSVCHEVAFTGPLGPVFALLLGGRFRRLLPGTVQAVVDLAEG